jgi:hypothetical protein
VRDCSDVLLNKGKHSNVNQIADEEGIRSPSYESSALRLVLLAPDIKEKILHSVYPATLTLANFLMPFPKPWELQRQKFGL